MTAPLPPPRTVSCSNARNLDALQLCVCAERLQGDGAGPDAALAALLELDPLNHFARFEQYLRGKARAKDFTALIRNELPHETFLELAAWYHGVGLDTDAAKVLDLAPPTAEVLYWLAYLRRDTNLLARAEAASPEFVFPFRTESIPVFEWAAQQRPAWQPNYFLALIRWHLGELPQARQLLAACGDEPRFAPFYAARAQLAEDDAVPDLQQAARLDPAQWRYGAMLARHYLKRGDPAAALAVADDYARRFPANDSLALLRAKSLLLTGQYQAAADFLSSLHVLPAEGTTEARALFHEAHLLLAVERLQAGAFDDALRLVNTAREWPESLGAGKPYPADLDERLEDWFTCPMPACAQSPRGCPPGARQDSGGARARRKGRGPATSSAPWPSSKPAASPKPSNSSKTGRRETPAPTWPSGALNSSPVARHPCRLHCKDLDCRVLAGIALAGIAPDPLPRE